MFQSSAPLAQNMRGKHLRTAQAGHMTNRRCKGIWETESALRRNCKGATEQTFGSGVCMYRNQKICSNFISSQKLCSSVLANQVRMKNWLCPLRDTGPLCLRNKKITQQKNGSRPLISAFKKQKQANLLKAVLHMRYEFQLAIYMCNAPLCKSKPFCLAKMFQIVLGDLESPHPFPAGRCPHSHLFLK